MHIVSLFVTTWFFQLFRIFLSCTCIASTTSMLLLCSMPDSPFTMVISIKQFKGDQFFKRRLAIPLVLCGSNVEVFLSSLCQPSPTLSNPSFGNDWIPSSLINCCDGLCRSIAPTTLALNILCRGLCEASVETSSVKHTAELCSKLSATSLCIEVEETQILKTETEILITFSEVTLEVFQASIKASTSIMSFSNLFGEWMTSIFLDQLSRGSVSCNCTPWP